MRNLTLLNRSAALPILLAFALPGWAMGASGTGRTGQTPLQAPVATSLPGGGGTGTLPAVGGGGTGTLPQNGGGSSTGQIPGPLQDAAPVKYP